ncbi:hypothetical protein CBL_05485 [Carabus blaptoides fortunei]
MKYVCQCEVVDLPGAPARAWSEWFVFRLLHRVYDSGETDQGPGRSSDRVNPPEREEPVTYMHTRAPAGEGVGREMPGCGETPIVSNDTIPTLMDVTANRFNTLFYHPPQTMHREISCNTKRSKTMKCLISGICLERVHAGGEVLWDLAESDAATLRRFYPKQRVRWKESILSLPKKWLSGATIAYTKDTSTAEQDAILFSRLNCRNKTRAEHKLGYVHNYQLSAHNHYTEWLNISGRIVQRALVILIGAVRLSSFCSIGSDTRGAPVLRAPPPCNIDPTRLYYPLAFVKVLCVSSGHFMYNNQSTRNSVSLIEHEHRGKRQDCCTGATLGVSSTPPTPVQDPTRPSQHQTSQPLNTNMTLPQQTTIGMTQVDGVCVVHEVQRRDGNREKHVDGSIYGGEAPVPVVLVQVLTSGCPIDN